MSFTVRSWFQVPGAVRRLIVGAGAALVVTLFCAPSASASGCVLDNVDPTCMYNGGLFLTNAQQPTGTGFIDSFLRVQMKGTEEGFNTNNRQAITNPSGTSAGTCDGTDCDSKIDQASYTRDIKLGDVRQVNGYYEFFLDVNEPASTTKSFISLDQLELFASNLASPLTGNSIEHKMQTINTGQGSLSINGTPLQKVYDLDTGADNWINIDYNLSGGGSGKADMVFYVPTSYFSTKGFTASSYVYLYSQFGCKNATAYTSVCSDATYKDPNGNSIDKFASGAGFEEWWVLGGGGTVVGQAAVPEPASLLLVGTGLVWAARRRRRGVAKGE